MLVYTHIAARGGRRGHGAAVRDALRRASAPHTDFTAKLVDVQRDGTPYNVSDGILRRQYRRRREPGNRRIRCRSRSHSGRPAWCFSRDIASGSRWRRAISRDSIATQYGTTHRDGNRGRRSCQAGRASRPAGALADRAAGRSATWPSTAPMLTEPRRWLTTMPLGRALRVRSAGACASWRAPRTSVPFGCWGLAFVATAVGSFARRHLPRLRRPCCRRRSRARSGRRPRIAGGPGGVPAPFRRR